MDYRTTRHHGAAVALFRESRVDAAGGSDAPFRLAELPRGDVAGSIRVGSEEHKALFCRMLLDTFSPYEPDSVVWPQLNEAARRRLCDLPIWDIAVQTEGKASRRALSYAETISDPLLRAALRLNAFE